MQQEKSILRILGLASMILLFTSFQIPVQAHSPSAMTLSYDIGTHELLVEVTHGPVSGVHRIAQIQVWKNDELVTTRLYEPPQETASGMDDTFNITANTGDVLKATASCSITGSITEEITVGADTTDTNTNGSSSPSPSDIPTTLIILIALVAIGLIAIVIGVLRRR